MSAALDPTTDVRAPIGAVAWSVARGWLTDPGELIAAEPGPVDPFYEVPADGVIRDVAGPASLAMLMHVDRRLLAVLREIGELHERLLDIAEAAVDRLAQHGEENDPR